ncbi:MAG: restriction endonuclease [Rickettsiales bacterium]|jgi:restriction system protein|nr:restriction endonuclease [Rickettsiales bacterium]
MTIPNYQEFMNPVLRGFAEVCKETRIKETESMVVKDLKLSEEEITYPIKSGKMTIVANRSYWATLYMTNAGLLERTKRGFYKITEEGLKVLKGGKKVNNDFLMQYPSFEEFLGRVGIQKKDYQKKEKITLEEDDPDTRLSNAINEITGALEVEILDFIKKIDPKKFEHIVVDLMEAMNYGIGKVTQYVGDGGVDGIIKEDELGLDLIYLQAKRYTDAKVNEKEMRDFIGALETHPVNKGVFITTSFFSDKAKALANSSKHYIIRLVDGYELVRLMIKYNLRVQIKKDYEVKEIDYSFFEE